MRVFVILAAWSLLLLGCNAKSHKTTPTPLAKKASFALFVVTAANGTNSKTEIGPDGQEIHLTTPAVITSTDVATVQLVEEKPSDPSQSGNILLQINLTPTSATKLAAVTATANGMRIAIVVNEKLVGVPRVHAPLSSTFVISNNEAESLFDLLTRE